MRKALLLPFLICVFCDPTSCQTSGTWKTVAIFSGRANETTDDFEIKSNKWRAVWTVGLQNPEWGVHFAAMVYKGGEMTEMLCNVMVEGAGKSVLRTKGTHYIKVTCMQAKWKIEVQEYVAK